MSQVGQRVGFVSFGLRAAGEEVVRNQTSLVKLLSQRLNDGNPHGKSSRAKGGVSAAKQIKKGAKAKA